MILTSQQLRILIKSGFYWRAQFNTAATVCNIIVMGNINFNRLGEKFTAVPVFYPPKFQKWDDNRKEEGRTTKRKTIRERIWILSLAVSFSIQYADFVKIYALDKHSILFYLSTFDLFTTFYRLFSKIFKEIISKAPLFFKIRLFWWKYEYALG